MNIESVLTEIKDSFSNTHLEEIRRFIKQPSVSADGNGIIETATMLSDKIKKLGGEQIELVDLSGDDFGHPIVYGEIYDNPAKTTILFYSMYDVQPVYPEKWIYNDQKIDPFGAEIIDFEWVPSYSGKCLMGRGVTNQKGPTIAFFNVLETYVKLFDELPFNIIFALEGEEELGSTHVGPFIDKYKEQLSRADVLLFPAFWENPIGKIMMPLGVRGVVALKLRCKGGEWGGPVIRNQHSSISGIIQSPVFKLIECINSLKEDSTNKILVPGIMEDKDIIGPDEEDKQVIRDYLKNHSFSEEIKRDGNIETLRFQDGKELTDEEAIIQMLFKPGISVNGIEGGYYGEGSMTIIPNEIRANLDIRLPPFQKRKNVIERYSQFFNKKFPMIEYEFEKGGYESGKIPFSHPLAQIAFSLYKEFNKEALVLPLLAGSAPFALYQSKLGIPFIVAGIGHSGRAHSPLEYAVLESKNPEVGGIIDFEFYIAKLLHKLSTDYKT